MTCDGSMMCWASMRSGNSVPNSDANESIGDSVPAQNEYCARTHSVTSCTGREDDGTGDASQLLKANRWVEVPYAEGRGKCGTGTALSALLFDDHAAVRVTECQQISFWLTDSRLCPHRWT